MHHLMIARHSLITLTITRSPTTTYHYLPQPTTRTRTFVALARYQARAPGVKLPTPAWDWADIAKLDISGAADTVSFVFLWCGSREGLQKGRECLDKWGFKRSEDIIWCKTNSTKPGTVRSMWDNAPLQSTTEHCLLGLRGHPQRKTDGHLIHCNIDTDVIIAEEPEYVYERRVLTHLELIVHHSAFLFFACYERNQFSCSHC